jgi:hypothetical protein
MPLNDPLETPSLGSACDLDPVAGFELLYCKLLTHLVLYTVFDWEFAQEAGG